MISAKQLYDFVRCPHRIFMDAFGDAVERDETSPFVELLWEQGLAHENAIAEGLTITANLSCLIWPTANEKLSRRWLVASHSSMADAFLRVIWSGSRISWNGPTAGMYLATSSPASTHAGHCRYEG